MPEIDIAVTVVYMAWDTGNLVGKTGDNGNHTLRGVSDGTEFTPAASPAEVDATNAPGIYKIAISNSENDGSMMTLCGKSSTSDIVIIPVSWTGKVNVTQVGGTAQTAGDIPALIDDLNDVSTAEVNAQVDTVLSDIDLDHLIQVSAGTEEPTDGAYLDQIMHQTADQTFDDTTDSLEALRDTMSSASITTVAAVDGDDITVVPYTTWEFTIDGLADLSDALTNGVIFTVKCNYEDADSSAILQVQEGVGLLRINGNAGTAAKATLTVGDDEDEITVHVNMSQTGLTEMPSLKWDIKKLITVTEDGDQMAAGSFIISDEAVTRKATTS